MPLVTFESVSEAARTLRAQGVEPSVRKVTAIIGGGSPKDVGRELRRFRDSETTVQKPRLPVNPKIIDLIAEQMEAIATDAASEADKRAMVAADDFEHASETAQVLEDRVQVLSTQLDELRQQTSDEVLALTKEKDAAQTLATERLAEITRLQEQLAREQAAAEAARTKAAQAQLTIDQQAKELEIKDESLKTTKSDLDAVRAAKDDAEKKLAVAEALAKVAEQSIQDEKGKHLDLQKRMDTLQAGKDKVDAELTKEKSKAAAAEASLEEKKALVEELRSQIAMVSAERDRALTDKVELTAERDRIREAYKSQGEASKRREAELKVEVEGLKESLAAERQQRLQDALDQQLGMKKTASKNGAKMEGVPVGA